VLAVLKIVRDCRIQGVAGEKLSGIPAEIDNWVSGRTILKNCPKARIDQPIGRLVACR
jgi:hypothetical protein